MASYYFIGQSVGGSGGSVTFPVLSTIAGSAGGPAYSFSAHTTTGIYYSSGLAFATAGSLALTINNSQNATFVGDVTLPAGTVAANALQVVDAGTGLYQPTTHQLALATNGTQAVLLDASQNATFAGQVNGITGSATAPAYTVRGEQTGIFSNGAGMLGFTFAGTAGFECMMASTNVSFQNITASSSSHGFNFIASNGVIAAVIDASDGILVKSGGVNASPGGFNNGSGSITYDGVASSNGAFGYIIGKTATATGLSGATVTVGSNLLPAGSIILGVALRVTTTITSGAGTSFTIGDGTNAAAYGTGIALAAGTTTNIANWTLTSAPVYASNANIILTCTGGTFTAGAVRVIVYYASCIAPTS